jgi:hypothetical protein
MGLKYSKHFTIYFYKYMYLSCEIYHNITYIRIHNIAQYLRNLLCIKSNTTKYPSKYNGGLTSKRRRNEWLNVEGKLMMGSSWRWDYYDLLQLHIFHLLQPKKGRKLTFVWNFSLKQLMVNVIYFLLSLFSPTNHIY